ncbi:MAG TPA: hypothetical protein PKA29_04070 [Candidatus Saccharibacteria bacterium]|nr:hypothetical protein [Candidatus Saccharibacteria bacterium]
MNLKQSLNLSAFLIKSKTKMILIYALIIIITNLLVITPYSSTSNLDLGSLISSLPEAYKAFFGDLNLMSTSTGFLAVKNFSLIYPMIQVILGISLATSFFGKLKTVGFFKFIVSRPISRTNIYFTVSLSYLFIMLLMNLINFFSIIVIAKFSNFSIDYSNLHLALISLNLMSMVVAGFCGLLAIQFEQELAIGMGYYFFFQNYILSSLVTLFPTVTKLKYLSIFHYYDYQNNLFGNSNPTYFMILAGLIIMMLLLGLISFKNKDF